MDDVIAKGWIAAMRRGLSGLPEAEVVLSRVGPRLDELLDLARRIETGPRTDRLAAVETLIERTGAETTELIDFAAAAVRLGVREAADMLGWTATLADDIERRAVDALLVFDGQIEALGGGSHSDFAFALEAAPTPAAPRGGNR